jgi:hypothetical protein
MQPVLYYPFKREVSGIKKARVLTSHEIGEGTDEGRRENLVTKSIIASENITTFTATAERLRMIHNRKKPCLLL